MPKVSTAELRDREYWTPEQAARVLGRGADFWRQAFHRGDVDGYPVPRKVRRKGELLDGEAVHIFASSARAYLQRLGASRPRPQRNNDIETMIAAFRARPASPCSTQPPGRRRNPKADAAPTKN